MQHFWKQFPLGAALRFGLGGMLALSASLVSGGARPAFAATWYVSVLAGNDTNDCATTTTPCKTINAVLGKPGFADNDIIRVTQGTATSTGSEVVLINRSVQLQGGWNSSFTTNFGITTIDGENARAGIVINSGVTVTMGRFTIRRALGNAITNAGTAVIERTTLADSTTGLNASGPTTLQLSTVNSNTTGIMVTGIITLTMRNTTVVYNGTGLQNQGGVMALNNVTIAWNNGGGGVVNNAGSTTFLNTILAGNTPNCSVTGGTLTSGGYNVVGTNVSGCTTLQNSDIASDEPALAPLRNNGGATSTLALFPGSPAVNKGSTLPVGAIGGCESADQREVSRPQLGICDIGAYESNQVIRTFLPLVSR